MYEVPHGMMCECERLNILNEVTGHEKLNTQTDK